MKKILLTLLAAGLCLSAAYSYNPPAGGEDLTLISSPSNLSGANSVAGGALFDAGSTSSIVNPALTAGEQRVNLNAGYTFLYSTEKTNEKSLESCSGCVGVDYSNRRFPDYADDILI